MRVQVKLPKLGLTMTEATLVEWRKSPGEPVAAAETLFVIETEKSEVEIPAPADGRLIEVIGEAGQTYPVGAVVAVIQTDMSA